MADWKAIQQEYIEGNLSMTVLANKHGVNRNTLRYHARAEEWAKSRDDVRRRADALMTQQAAERRARMLETAVEIGSKILAMVLEILRQHEGDAYTRITEQRPDGMNEYDFTALVDALIQIGKLFGFDAGSRLEYERLKLARAKTRKPD